MSKNEEDLFVGLSKHWSRGDRVRSVELPRLDREGGVDISKYLCTGFGPVTHIKLVGPLPQTEYLSESWVPFGSSVLKKS